MLYPAEKEAREGKKNGPAQAGFSAASPKKNGCG